MTINNFVIPSETVLVENYENLSPEKQSFIDYLVEKRNYAINRAILIAQNIPDGVKIRKMEPRLESILERESFYCESLIDLKRYIKIYRELPEHDKTLLYVSVVHNFERFDQALKSIKDESMSLTGYFSTMEEFGKHLVFEQDELYDHYLQDLYDFFLPDVLKWTSVCKLKSTDIYELIDYEKVAERFVYGLHGGGGISYYSRYDDPEVPEKWLFVRYK